MAKKTAAAPKAAKAKAAPFVPQVGGLVVFTTKGGEDCNAEIIGINEGDRLDLVVKTQEPYTVGCVKKATEDGELNCWYEISAE
jgi:hypothetical protein